MRALLLVFPFADSRPFRLLMGLVLSIGLALLATATAQLDWFRDHGVGVMTLAIVFGMAVGNTIYRRLAPAAGEGVQFARQTLLRIGIVLYGFRLSFADLGQVGLAGVLIDALVLITTIGLAAWIGVRVLKLDRDTALLVGAGNAICGAAAVMATAPVLRARSEQAAVAVATVVLFGTLAMFSYPVLFQLLQAWRPDAVTPDAFGIYAGSTVHEVAQVVAVGRCLGEDAAHAAVVAKMMRVMMLAPFLVLLSAYVMRGPSATDVATGGGRDGNGSITIPWFAFLFIAVVGLQSLLPLPLSLLHSVTAFDDVLLATAMAALGLTTQLSAMRRAGGKCLLLAAILFAWLVVGGAAINWAVLH